MAIRRAAVTSLYPSGSVDLVKVTVVGVLRDLYLGGASRGGRVRLAFLDGSCRAVCSTATSADGLWGADGRASVQVCLDMLAEALNLGQLAMFAMLVLGITTFHGGIVVAVRHREAEVIVSPIDTDGTLLPIARGADMTMLKNVACLSVLHVSWRGVGADERKAG